MSACGKRDQDKSQSDQTSEESDATDTDDERTLDGLRTFVGTVAAAGVVRFVVHARKAVLSGLDPKRNREVPPLRPVE